MTKFGMYSDLKYHFNFCWCSCVCVWIMRAKTVVGVDDYVRKNKIRCSGFLWVGASEEATKRTREALNPNNSWFTRQPTRPITPKLSTCAFFIFHYSPHFWLLSRVISISLSLDIYILNTTTNVPMLHS